MSKIFSIDAGVRQVVQDALDDLLLPAEEGGLGKHCLLVYPPRYVTCDCQRDAVGNKPSARGPNGAPAPFPYLKGCPACNGEGRKATQATEDVVLKCAWDARKFSLPVPNLQARLPYSVVQTKGYLSDVPKLMKADHILINLPIAPFLRQTFKMVGTPGDPSNIVQARYCFALWEQVNV